ncbi:hypothetical protein [Nonomuraea sp. NPDC049646]|uniref:hypothetical protein n=1 Tax=unclassified Nonomuraea TaxID=2593643 RepID=UPI0037A34FC3
MSEPRPTEQVVPVVSDQGYEWCRRCQATTVATATISAVTSERTYTIGGYAICEQCGWSPYAGNAAAGDG